MYLPWNSKRWASNWFFQEATVDGDGFGRYAFSRRLVIDLAYGVRRRTRVSVWNLRVIFGKITATRKLRVIFA